MKSFSELTSASQVNNGDLLAISQTSGSGYASKKTTVKDITDISNLNLAEEYDSTSTYAVDDYVIYESVLYKCIATTTGAFDSTKWTQVVVTDEMGSGGGGGTGGHTIIDENGNSMTARAGLQFVGGVNVSDDATNNKTIVDLASAGGIDGVFIDTDNVIQAWTTFTSETTYTATEDCIVVGGISTTSGKTATISVDGSVIYSHYSQNGEQSIEVPIRLKKGQTILLHNETDWANINGYVVYGIQTGTTHSKFQPVIYSTEEREIGVWEDGKPLYQKTIITTSLSVGKNTIPHGISNIDYVQFESGSYYYGNGDSAIPLPFGDDWKPVTNSAVLVECITDTDISFGIGTNYTGSSAAPNKVTFTLQYTKTTDVAGSGTWTPQGVPAVHYSTDEQIIGTFLGETLYGRIFEFNQDLEIAYNSYTTTNITDSSYKQLVNCIGFYTPSGAMYSLFGYFDNSGNLKLQTTRNGEKDAINKLYIEYTKSS